MALASAPTLLGVVVTTVSTTVSLSSLPTTAGALIIVLTGARRLSANPAVLNPSCTIPLTGASGVGAVYDSGAHRYRTMAHYGTATGDPLNASLTASGGWWLALAVLQWVGAASLGLAGEAGITGAGTLTPSMGGTPAASSAAVAWAVQNSATGYAAISGWTELGEGAGDVDTAVAEFDAPGSPETSIPFVMSTHGRALIAEVVEAPSGLPGAKRHSGMSHGRAHPGLWLPGRGAVLAPSMLRRAA